QASTAPMTLFRWARTASKVAPARRRTLRAGRADAHIPAKWSPVRRQGYAPRKDSGEGGVVLLEIVAVLAIIALLAAILLPAIPRATSRSRLEAYAVQVASLLTLDRNAAIRRRTQIRTQVDPPSRVVLSGATGQAVRLPNDVVVRSLV